MNDLTRNLEEQFQNYLQRAGYTPQKMNPTQLKVMRDTFFAACGQMLVLIRDGIGAIENEDVAIAAMQDLLNQVGNHFLKSSQN